MVAGLARDRHHFEHLQTLEWVDIPSWATHPLLNLAWHQTFLVILLRRLRIKVLHIPSYRRVVAFPTCPQVVTVHDCAAFSCKGKYDFLRHLFGSRILPPLIRRAARVIAVSETTRSDVRKYLGVPEIRIQTIPNGVQSIFFKECSEGEIQNRLAALGVSRPFFLYVSRLEHPAKNHVGLVEAFEILQKADRWFPSAGVRRCRLARCEFYPTKSSRVILERGDQTFGVRGSGGSPRSLRGRRGSGFSLGIRRLWASAHRGDGLRVPGSCFP